MRERRISFYFPETIDPHWVQDEPEFSLAANAGSMLLPHVEPYLIRTMKEALPRLADQQLKEQVRTFCLQEARHYHEHRKLNDRLIAIAYPWLSNYDTRIAREFSALTRNRSLKFNVAYAAGFEAFTFGFAQLIVDGSLGYFKRSQGVIASLFFWHLCEEMEHRCVAHDVYKALFGGSRGQFAYRILLELYAAQHLIRILAGITILLFRADRHRLDLQYGGRIRSWIRTIRFVVLTTCLASRRIVASLMPNYDPHRIDPPDAVAGILGEYDKEVDAIELT